MINRDKICFYSSMYRGRSSTYEIIDCAERFEVGGVELMNFSSELCTADITVAREIGKYTKARGLCLPCFSVGIDAITDPAQSIKKLQAYAEICSELEIPYLHHTIALDYRCGRLDPTEREKRFNTGIGIALSLADFCAPLGVRTLIEPQGFVFNGIEWVDRTVRLSDERIGVVADVGNVLFSDTDPAEFIRTMGGRVCHSHLKDYTYKPDSAEYRSEKGRVFDAAEIGRGDIDFPGVFGAFRDINYNGFYALEFENADGDTEVARVLDFLTR